MSPTMSPMNMSNMNMIHNNGGNMGMMSSMGGGFGNTPQMIQVRTVLPLNTTTQLIS